MLKELAEVWRFRELLINLVVRDIRVRYKNSVLGFFWLLIMPLAQVATFTFVFKYVMQLQDKNFSAYLFCGLLPFNFFAQSINEASSSVMTYGNLIKKTYFPMEIIPASVVLSNFVHFVLAEIVFFVYLLVLRLISHDGHPAVLSTWLLLPGLMIISLLLTMGTALFLTCANTFFEDVKFITTVVTNLLFYALPILYPIELALQVPHHKVGLLIRLHFLGNPLAYLEVAYKKILLEPFAPMLTPGNLTIVNTPLDYRYLALAAVTSTIIFVAGYSFFNKTKWHLAERL